MRNELIGKGLVITIIRLNAPFVLVKQNYCPTIEHFAIVGNRIMPLSSLLFVHQKALRCFNQRNLSTFKINEGEAKNIYESLLIKSTNEKLHRI